MLYSPFPFHLVDSSLAKGSITYVIWRKDTEKCSVYKMYSYIYTYSVLHKNMSAQLISPNMCGCFMNPKISVYNYESVCYRFEPYARLGKFRPGSRLTVNAWVTRVFAVVFDFCMMTLPLYLQTVTSYLASVH